MLSDVHIRKLDPIADHGLVKEMYDHARDYWALDRVLVDTSVLAANFFTNAPPNCDPVASYRLGLFAAQRLAGIAELSFGFPEPQDAYLGVMIFADWARKQGFGVKLLNEVEAIARAHGCDRIFLGVLETNHMGRAFWLREGFEATDVIRFDSENGIENQVRRYRKQL